MKKILPLIVAVAAAGWLAGCAANRTQDEAGVGAPGGTAVFGPEGAGSDTPDFDQTERNNRTGEFYQEGTTDMNRPMDNSVPGETHDSGAVTDGTKGPI